MIKKNKKLRETEFGFVKFILKFVNLAKKLYKLGLILIFGFDSEFVGFSTVSNLFLHLNKLGPYCFYIGTYILK